jgi:uncharacterized protein (TIGR01244 family)
VNAASKPLSVETVAIPNGQQATPKLITGGAPDADALKAAAEAGVRYVFDLRPASERSFDEPAVVAAEGMEFLHLPIAGAEDLTLARAREFDALLNKIGDQPALLHCASGNRVGALMALRAAWMKGASSEHALSIGRAHGLTRMEPIVKGLLTRGPG